MRAALLITLVAFGSFAQGRFDRFNARTSQGRSTRGFEQSSYAFFEFAPASGAGMGTACACTTPTSAKGDALTFTRAGDATCSKQGLATTGIANGDLVVCTANQPRVESSGGVLGLRVEGARTNSVLRSSEFDNAAWADDSNPVAPITITANQATAPDNTLTAERFQIPARTATQWSLRRQPIAAGSTGSASVYLKGNGTSGVVSLIADGALATCIDCVFNPSTWTRCTLSAAGAWIFIGSASGYGACAGGSRAAEDVFVWGGQTEGSGVATYATSYIPTVAAAVTRNAETPNFSGVSLAGLASTGCARAYAARPTGATHGTAIYFETSGRPLYFTALGQTVFDGTNNPNLATTFNGSAKWYITRWTGSSLTLHNQDTTAATTAFDGTMGVTGPLVIGDSAPNLQLDGIISRIQLDPSPTRCTQ